MSRFGITPQKELELLERMGRLGIREEDLDEQFVRSSGAGGQKVNKTSSAVHLRHLPTGIDVKCQEGRSQAINRFFARRRLCERIEEMQLGTESPEAQRRAKISKQKKRRRRRNATHREAMDNTPLDDC